MPAIFAQPTTDENLTPGWSVQGTGAAGSPGPGAPGYGQAGNPTTVLTTGQALSGLPQPVGALNIGAENSSAYSVPVLSNAGYADATGPANRTLPATIGGSALNPPAIASATALTNPSASLAALVTIAGGTVTQIKVGTAGQTYAQMTAVTGTSGSFTVPPGGTFGITYSVAPTTYTWAV